MPRSSTRHDREIYGLDSAGEPPWEHGEWPNDMPNTPITVIDAFADVTKNSLTLTLDAFVQGSSGFTMTSKGAAVTLTDPQISRNNIKFTTSPVDPAGPNLLSYAPGDVESLVGRPLEAFSDMPVTVVGSTLVALTVQAVENPSNLLAAVVNVGSNDPAANDKIQTGKAALRYDMGDGTIVDTSQPTQPHVYAKAGRYEIAVVATDNEDWGIGATEFHAYDEVDNVRVFADCEERVLYADFDPDNAPELAIPFDDMADVITDPELLAALTDYVNQTCA